MRFLCSSIVLAALCQLACASIVVRDTGGEESDFPLVSNDRAAVIVHDEQDHRVVAIAAECLAADVERVSGVKPHLERAATVPPGAARVIIGSLDRSRLIQSMVEAKKLDVADLRGQWECFKFARVDDALVIVGSDRRGTAYGVFELSRAIGVSPWYWWADVPPKRRAQLHVALTDDSKRVGPPSVRYRGIFLNDEDWGLQPWAAKTYEPETGDIGPKTYARIFELLLRLRANFCWPAMHDCTRAFNHYPRNKQVADDYAIVMGSSHAEPMLRNNVDEWPRDRHDDWNPVTNLPGILDYWEQRVRENGKYENVWTVGMRGIHDGSMPGGGTIEQKRERLEKVVALQREMLAKHVNADPSRVPQIFCPYKEVLEIYQAGMELPDDITIVWPDDNFGYIRQLPGAREQQRGGGHGIYYHLSYWGRPHDYLWLESTSPALIWHEMTKAYDYGARRLWVANVGDLKPIEAGTTLFLDLAWDIERYGPDVQRKFLRDFYAEQFGEEHADAIAESKDGYFRLCAIRRPEHLGFNRVYPNTPVADGDWTADEASRLLQRWLDLAGRAETIAAELPEQARPAYFQLVEYPTCAGAAMAEKLIVAEQARRSESKQLAARVEAAQRRIEQLTERYNAQSAGKWRGMMNARPRKLPVFDMPPASRPAHVTMTMGSPPHRDANVINVEATRMFQSRDGDGARWSVVSGLGPRGAAIAVLPRRSVATLRSPEEIRAHAPVAEYAIERGDAGEVEITVEALPTHPLTPAHELLTAVSIDDGLPSILRFDQGADDERDPIWQSNVLRGATFGKTKLRAPAAPYTLKLWAADAGVVIQRLAVAEPRAVGRH